MLAGQGWDGLSVSTPSPSLMAVMLPMDTVGPLGAEEVHRNLGALGGGL